MVGKASGAGEVLVGSLVGENRRTGVSEDVSILERRPFISHHACYAGNQRTGVGLRTLPHAGIDSDIWALTTRQVSAEHARVCATRLAASWTDPVLTRPRERRND